MFDVHPYDTHYKGGINLNATNISLIETRYRNCDTLRVAFISDTHLWHKEFREEVKSINSNDSIDFVVHCGDFTDTGTTREFEWGWNIIKKLNKPYVVLIGNHDFLGTGDEVWKKEFGTALDFSFIAARTKFICINTNATEYDYMAAVPNFDYIQQQFYTDSADFDRTVFVMHACPGSDQFNNNVKDMFDYVIKLFPGLQCCIYGHDHSRTAIDIFHDGVMWYGIDAAVHRNYQIFTFTPNGYRYETVHF
ncbi:metallophosphoesterase family protein [Hallella multisaccharivorax]|uniref:metallophosphoesterase family protein n=1 Tax=Hallella multisaccharivorax TaxID=310514 RepID=UPI003607537C